MKLRVFGDSYVQDMNFVEQLNSSLNNDFEEIHYYAFSGVKASGLVEPLKAQLAGDNFSRDAAIIIVGPNDLCAQIPPNRFLSEIKALYNLVCSKFSICYMTTLVDFDVKGTLETVSGLSYIYKKAKAIIYNRGILLSPADYNSVLKKWAKEDLKVRLIDVDIPSLSYRISPQHYRNYSHLNRNGVNTYVEIISKVIGNDKKKD